MRLRIASLLLAAMAAALTALGVPLAQALAAGFQQDLYVSRLADVSRFSSLAGQVSTEGDLADLEQDLRRYEQVYGVSAAVLDRRGTPVASSGSPVDLDAEGGAAVEVALTGRRADPPTAVGLGQDGSFVIAEPVVQGGDVTGVVVSVSPADRLRERTALAWTALAAGMLAVLGLCFVLAVRLASWVLRPVHALDAATQAVGTGRLGVRVPDTTGPPELRRLSKAFNDMAGHVQGLVEQQKAFVADASHELRNPLAVLLLRLDEVELSTPSVAPKLEPVRAEGRRLGAVLDELLELARAEHSVLVSVPVALGQLLHDRAETWQVLARSRQLRVRIDSDDPVVLADPVGLSSAVDALVDNALKFSQPQGEVVLGARAVDDRVVLTVRDTGSGLDDEELQRLGDRFWRSPRHQNVPGSGLGLSIVRVLVERWGGRLAARRVESGGLEVCLDLPVAPSALEAGTDGPGPQSAAAR